MTSRMVEHWGMVKAIDGGIATVVVETTACPSCGHHGHCGVSHGAGGSQSTLLCLPATEGLHVGDFVHVGVPESGLSLAAFVGYLFPFLAMVLGALIAYATAGEMLVAIGAAGGFVLSLVLARIAIAMSPILSPMPRILPPSQLSLTLPQE